MAISTNLGFPRIGPNREFKKVIEAYWKGEKTAKGLEAALEMIHEENLHLQAKAGLNYIPLGDFSAYDLMLETSLMLGVIPKRFAGLKGWERYYAMARGTQTLEPCEMKKWFDTNYHYIVPEVEGGFALTENRLVQLYQEARQKFPKQKFRLVLIGPFTFLRLARIKNSRSLEENLAALAPVYQKIVAQVAQTGCEWLQLDEPALGTDVTDAEWKALAKAVETLTASKGGMKVLLQTYFGDVAPLYEKLCRLPVDGIGLDLVRGPKNAQALQKSGTNGKWIGLGLLDGRGVWKPDWDKIWNILETLKGNLDWSKTFISPSCSLLHLPVSKEKESRIPPALKENLSFAVDRLAETVTLTQSLNQGKKPAAAAASQAFAKMVLDPAVQKRMKELKPEDFRRHTPFAKRIQQQQNKLKLPPLPTTTIGSFPQTKEIRQARANWKKGGLSQRDYEKFIHEEISRVVALQEEIGLDVLVHGEPERTDMVEYFAERMNGFQFTQNGWVQSYGTRCIRPPIIYGDVSRPKPMTVAEAKIAQELTKKPMKGMLTGPVTIVNWSFCRADVPKSVSAMQIALGLRDEVKDLEAAGIGVIQIDEPALREGLPLKRADWAGYLKWAVESFRLSSSAVKDTTQIHTHMCYSEFADILDSIQALDADALSIEDSRSHGRLAKSLADMNYRNGIGPGVYDVHSERVPPREELAQRVKFLADHIPLEQLWINPDCGLKTRGYKEVIPSLKNMVEAVKEVRRFL